MEDDKARVRISMMVTREFYRKRPDALKEIVWQEVCEQLDERWPPPPERKG